MESSAAAPGARVNTHNPIKWPTRLPAPWHCASTQVERPSQQQSNTHSARDTARRARPPLPVSEYTTHIVGRPTTLPSGRPTRRDEHVSWDDSHVRPIFLVTHSLFLSPPSTTRSPHSLAHTGTLAEETTSRAALFPALTHAHMHAHLADASERQSMRIMQFSLYKHLNSIYDEWEVHIEI
jgi:hypothetical protein